MSSFETSAMRRSSSDLLAVDTADLAASSHDVLLVPITSMTRYTPSLEPFLAMMCSPFSICRRFRRLARGLVASYARGARLAPYRVSAASIVSTQGPPRAAGALRYRRVCRGELH